MDCWTRKLLSDRSFLVTIIPLVDELNLTVDDRDMIELGIGRNLGNKTLVPEATLRLGASPDRKRPADGRHRRVRFTVPCAHRGRGAVAQATCVLRPNKRLIASAASAASAESRPVPASGAGAAGLVEANETLLTVREPGP
jgi:hypothetical protein